MRAKCNLPADHTEYPKTYKVLGIVGIENKNEEWNENGFTKANFIYPGCILVDRHISSCDGHMFDYPAEEADCSALRYGARQAPARSMDVVQQIR